MGKFFKLAVGTKMHAIPVGSMVENVNPSCRHRGSMGKVVSSQPHQTTYIVMNTGKNYKKGDKLTKTNEQLEKKANMQRGYAGAMTPALMSQIAEQNNMPVAVPQPQAVSNPAINAMQIPSPKLPSPPEGNSQGQKIPPQKPKGKYMNRNNLDNK
tara:strand:+ start:31272 stop:31736 length:465 start_codon:yes stop_codon:yes gene_type:complete